MQSKYTRSPVSHMPPGQAKHRLIQEIGEFCFRCMAAPKDNFKVALTVDHIAPVARGGMSVLENFQLLCVPCNSWKGTKIIDFRPGKSRKEINVDLPIIPNELRVRKTRLVKKEMPALPAPVAAPLDLPEPAPSVSEASDVSEALRILEERLAFADTLIRANGDSLARQAEQIDGLHRENANLRERAGRAEERTIAADRRADEAERDRATAEGRAALLAEQLDAERARATDLAETTRAQSRQIAAQAESIADLAARLRARRWWKPSTW